MHVLCDIGTRGRTESTLAMCLQSIASQTRPPDHLLVIDDNQQPQTVADSPLVGPLLRRMSEKMTVSVVRGPGRGPHHNHEYARTCEHAKELIWRVDDDECPESNVLAELEKVMIENADVGGVASSVFIPGTAQVQNQYASSQLEDIFNCCNVQNCKFPKGTRHDNVGHLHSTYLYRKGAASYDLNMSPVGHTEETRHTVRMRMNCMRLVVLNDLVTWHHRQPNGGIRSQQGDYARDEADFRAWLSVLPVTYRKRFPIVFTQGIGDCFALYSALPKFLPQALERFDEVCMFVKPELLPMIKKRVTGNKLRVMPLDDMGKWYFTGQFQAYSWWAEAERRLGWKGNLVDAYANMYTDRLANGVAQ